MQFWQNTTWIVARSAGFTAYGLLTLHGFFVGTDAGTWWSTLIYLSSVLLVGVVFWQRMEEPPMPTKQSPQQ